MPQTAGDEPIGVDFMMLALLLGTAALGLFCYLRVIQGKRASQARAMRGIPDSRSLGELVILLLAMATAIAIAAFLFFFQIVFLITGFALNSPLLGSMSAKSADWRRELFRAV